MQEGRSGRGQLGPGAVGGLPLWAEANQGRCLDPLTCLGPSVPAGTPREQEGGLGPPEPAPANANTAAHATGRRTNPKLRRPSWLRAPRAPSGAHGVLRHLAPATARSHGLPSPLLRPSALGRSEDRYSQRPLGSPVLSPDLECPSFSRQLLPPSGPGEAPVRCERPIVPGPSRLLQGHAPGPRGRRQPARGQGALGGWASRQEPTRLLLQLPPRPGTQNSSAQRLGRLESLSVVPEESLESKKVYKEIAPARPDAGCDLPRLDLYHSRGERSRGRVPGPAIYWLRDPGQLTSSLETQFPCL